MFIFFECFLPYCILILVCFDIIASALECSIIIDLISEHPEVSPCSPSPCGANTLCRASGGNALCECLPGFHGSPTGSGCRPECVISSDCPRDKACANTKCIDPCPGVCGYGALCQVINHSPICSCPAPTIGDPFLECKAQPRKFTFLCNTFIHIIKQTKTHTVVSVSEGIFEHFLMIYIMKLYSFLFSFMMIFLFHM